MYIENMHLFFTKYLRGHRGLYPTGDAFVNQFALKDLTLQWIHKQYTSDKHIVYT